MNALGLQGTPKESGVLSPEFRGGKKCREEQSEKDAQGHKKKPKSESTA